jgi:hypothetical protein
VILEAILLKRDRTLVALGRCSGRGAFEMHGATFTEVIWVKLLRDMEEPGVCCNEKIRIQKMVSTPLHNSAVESENSHKIHYS